jgi:hypothetical protein
MDEKKSTKTDKAISAGPFVPLVTPANVGQKSGGEVNWDAASATPYTTEKK